MPSTWTKVRNLDFWLGAPDADRFRRRRSRGTRLPLYRGAIDVRSLLWVFVLMCLPFAGMKLLGSGDTALGVVAVAVGLSVVAAVVRYIRLPTDLDET